MFSASNKTTQGRVFSQLNHGTLAPTANLTDRHREQRAISYPLESLRHQQNPWHSSGSAMTPERPENGDRKNVRQRRNGRIRQMRCVYARVTRPGRVRHAGVLCSRDWSTVRLLHDCWGVIFVMRKEDPNRCAERGAEVVAQLVDQGLAEHSRGPGEQQVRAFTPWTEGGRGSGFGWHSRTPRGCGAGWRVVVRGEDTWDQAMVSGPSARYAASGPVIRCRAGGCRSSPLAQVAR